MSLFKKATKAQLKARIGLVGPTGSGKTYTALTLAKHLAGNGDVVVIDTENGSASKYSGDVADFFIPDAEHINPETGKPLRITQGDYSPEAYVEAIEAVDREGAAVLVIDSLSHAWMGKGGALELVDQAAKRSRSGNSFTAWRDVTPLQNKMIEAILQCKMHVIATLRSKTEYVVEEDGRGKKVPRKIGMAPVQRDGLEYEFDIVAEMTADHEAIFSKSRCSTLADEVVKKPGKGVAETILAWLSDGEERTVDRLARELNGLATDYDTLRDWTLSNREHVSELREIAGRLRRKAGDCGADWAEVGDWIKNGERSDTDESAPEQQEESEKAA